MSGTCAVCSAPAQQRCAVCKNVHYCGKEHQKQHWKIHKSECCCYRVAVSEKLGRYIVASRDIQAGEVILKEVPLVIGPKVASYPVCLGCNRTVKATSADEDSPLDYYHCPDCGWPLCAPRCKNTPLHKAECKLMKEKGIKSEIIYQDQPRKESSYCAILPLRCLLLEPQRLQTILSLESHLEMRRNTQLYKLFRNNIVGYIQDALGLKQFDEEMILTIAAILDTNAFEIRRNLGKVKVRGLYPQAAMLSHDCKPNTKHIFLGDEFTLVLTATMDIKKGDVISATYTQTLWGTQARQQHLKLAKCFECTCARCSDPTEFNTYLSSILCSKCKGYVIPKFPLNINSDWKCKNCSHTIAAKQMHFGNEVIKKELDSMSKSIAGFEELLDKYLKDATVLHSQNQHIVQAKYALSQLYGNSLTDLTASQLERATNICQDLLELADILDPGLSRFRGSLLYDLQAIQVVQIKRDFESDRITKQKTQELLGDTMAILEEAAQILKTEPDLAYLIQDKLKELSELCS